MLPSSLYIMSPMQVSTSNGLGDAFTRKYFSFGFGSGELNFF